MFSRRGAKWRVRSTKPPRLHQQELLRIELTVSQAVRPLSILYVYAREGSMRC